MKAHSILFLAFLLSSGISTKAEFAVQQTTQVPVGRVLQNLQQRLATNTNDVKILYYLARVHSMAYATTYDFMVNMTADGRPVFGYPDSDAGVPEKVTPAAVGQERMTAQQHLTNAISYYERVEVLMTKGTNSTTHRWLISPIKLGLAWCLDQAGRRQEAIKAYRKALQYSWQVEVEGDYSIKEWLEWSWDRIRAKKIPIGRPKRGYRGPGVCYSEEIIGYLLKLLDPVKDAKEIAQLKEDQKELKKMGRAITPILLPVESGNSFDDLIDPAASIRFDLDGSGSNRKWGWITSRAAWLVFDSAGKGKITSGLQMFGSVTFWIFWQNGYDALSVLDNNGDGVLRGEELRGLALWQDRNGNGISDSGEVTPVQKWGITGIRCGSELNTSGILFNPEGVMFEDGTTRPTYDWNVPSAVKVQGKK